MFKYRYGSGASNSARANARNGLGGGSPLLQTAIVTSLAAAGLDSRFGYVGLGLTVVAAVFSRPLAFVLATLHLAEVIANGGADVSAIPTVAAGLVSGMLVTPWAVSAALTWVIVAAASVITLFELEVSLWFALIPLAIISTTLSISGPFLTRLEDKYPTKKRSLPGRHRGNSMSTQSASFEVYDTLSGEEEDVFAYTQKNTSISNRVAETEWGNMFV